MTRDSGSFYGGQRWLVPDDRLDVPADAYATAGNRGRFVVVRGGLDYGKQGVRSLGPAARSAESIPRGRIVVSG